MSSDKSGSPPCGIYVRIDDLSNMLDAIGQVRKMAFAINRASGYEKNLCAVEIVYTKAIDERVRDIIPIIRDQGFVALVSGVVDETLGADGVILEAVSAVRKARDTLGDDMIIGVVCASDDDAKAAVSIGADLVVLNADPALISRWVGQNDVMCMARGKGVTYKNCGALVRAGAGFIDLTDYIYKIEDDILQATVNVMHAIDSAAQMPKVLN